MVDLNARLMRHEILHYASSGSEHEGARESDRVSELSETRSLSDLVECFLEDSWDDEIVVEEDVHEACRVRTESTQRSDSVACVEMSRILSDKNDYRNLLVSQVHQAIELSFCYVSLQTVSFHEQQTLILRSVMTHLRSLGHNAAICKTKWDTSKSGGLVSGSHEFIDILTTTTKCSNQKRYIIELDLASKFEIVRPTESYERLITLLPKSAVVATEDEMKRIVKLMSDEAKKSLKSRELHLPPWRKNRYMQMKWFGPYKRTTNALPGGARSGLGGGSDGDGRWNVECRAVGFEPVCNGVNGRYFVSIK